MLDEELIEAMSSAVAAESERAQKFHRSGRGKDISNISQVEVLETSKKDAQKPDKCEIDLESC